MSAVWPVQSRVEESARADDPYVSRAGTRAETVPREDRVTYGEGTRWQTASSLLSEEQVRRYDSDGFMVLDDLFTAEELHTLQMELQRLRRRHDDIDPDTVITEPGGDELRSIFRIHQQSAVMRRLAHDARLVGIAQRILGDAVYVHQSRLNYKPGFFGKEFYWHSDFETWHVEDGMPRMRALSISLALTQNTGFNGPLMVMPGSHRRYVRCVGATPDDHYKQSLRKQEYGVPDPASLHELFELGGIAMPTGAPGRIVAFDCNTMHGSNSNISPLPRSNVFIVYNAMSNRLVAPFGGKSPRPEFIATRTDIQAIEPRMGSLV